MQLRSAWKQFVSVPYLWKNWIFKQCDVNTMKGIWGRRCRRVQFFWVEVQTPSTGLTFVVLFLLPYKAGIESRPYSNFRCVANFWDSVTSRSVIAWLKWRFCIWQTTRSQELEIEIFVFTSSRGSLIHIFVTNMGRLQQKLLITGEYEQTKIEKLQS